MGSLARQIQQEQNEQRQQQPLKQPKKAVRKKSWLSPGEKVLAIVFAGFVCFGAVQIISNQSEIYSLNKEIQKTEAAIEAQGKVNADLNMQIAELSGYERIKTMAQKLGLEFNEKNVKAVQN